MAKADDEITPTQKWVKLGQYRDLHAGRIGRLDFANQRVLEELKGGLPFRFIDLNDIQRRLQDKLPNGYSWDLADVDWDSAAAVWPERTVNHAVKTETMISMGVHRFPELRMYGIEVAVSVKSETTSPTAVAVPVKSETTSPVAVVDPFKTGVAGRPSAVGVVEAEAKRRVADGEVTPRRGELTKFSDDLAAWWETEQTKQPSPTPRMTSKTIQTRLRGWWNRLCSK